MLIIKYLEPPTGDLFIVRYANCIFNEDHFPTLGEIASTIGMTSPSYPLITKVSLSLGILR
jgi:hypothetical protein